tara:strand:- start:6224 stop:6952 length:729 start_codon:yes stop_codon:yes gene_type:complete
MTIPCIYIYHPPETRSDYAHINHQLAKLDSLMNQNPNWDNCDVITIPLDDQLGFDVANEVRRIKEKPGPIIFIYKYQRKLYTKLSDKLCRVVNVYSIEKPTCEANILEMCNQAADAHRAGEPRIPKRELIAFCIIAKLARGDYWAGESMNKAFLYKEDLPKGGFPSFISKSDVFNAADALFNAELLKRKSSNGKLKYGLSNKSTIQPIIDNRSFSGNRKMIKWFQKGSETVPARELENITLY